MNTFKTSGFKSVKAETMRQAAERLALTMARKKYGRTARVAALCAGGWVPGWSQEFSAFIGYPLRNGPETVGHNVTFTLYCTR